MKSLPKGFTLVELMVVVSIIALLVALAIPNLLRARLQANDTSAKATLKLISNALENYYAINSDYPLDTSLLIGANPPYLSKDYFTGTLNGFTFTANLGNYTYVIVAEPTPGQGSRSFTISTGAVFAP